MATLAEYIRGDLTNRLGAEGSAPEDLTLAGLSRHYGVSLTPVREAVRELISAGLLLKGRDGRLRALPRLEGRADVPRVEGPMPPVRAERLEGSLTSEVIRLGLLGRDDYLREEATARRFGVGRTAIRHALSRLAGRGLIVHVPRCGWRIRAFDERDMADYLEVRETLELKALELARPRLVTRDLRRMLAGNVAERGVSRLNNDLHGYLVEKSGNAYIRDFFARHSAYYTALFDFAAPETRVVAEMVRQHRRILRALISGDWGTAREALVAHIRAQRPIVSELMSRLGRPVRPPEPIEEPR